MPLSESEYRQIEVSISAMRNVTDAKFYPCVRTDDVLDLLSTYRKMKIKQSKVIESK